MQHDNFKFYSHKGYIYVSGWLNGKRYRKSTKQKYDQATWKRWTKNRDPKEFLVILVGDTMEQTSKKILFKDYGDEYLKSRKKGGKAYKKDLKGIFNNILIPEFGDKSIDKIKPSEVVMFLETIDKVYCKDRCKRIKSVMHKVLSTALDDDLITKNPFNAETVSTIKFTNRKLKTEVYYPDEISKILEHSTGWLRVFLHLSLLLGSRTGEIIGLQWNDINLEEGYLEISRSISKGEITYDSTEKDHDRKIYLSDKMVVMLKRYENFKPHEKWLFVNKNGVFFKNSRSIYNHFKLLLDKIGIEHKTLYATRRSYASIMYSASTDDEILQEEVQGILGHKAGSEVTKKHYIFDLRTESQKRKRANQLEKKYYRVLQKYISEM